MTKKRPPLAPLLAVALVVASPVLSAETERSRSTQPAHKEMPRMRESQRPPDASVGTLPPDIGIPVGGALPDVAALDAAGREVKLRDLARRGPLLVVFYRGGWCPFCNFQIRELTKAFPQFQQRGVGLVAVSVDRMDEAAKTKALYDLPFPVLSDADLAVHRAFRVTHTVDDAERSRLLGFGMDIERSSGKGHHVIAVPSLFLVDQEGKVRWAHADRDYKVRPSVEQILRAIDGAQLSKAPR